MKNENHSQSLDENALSFSDPLTRTCSLDNPATLVCCSKTCDKVAFLCGSKSCQCYKQHNKCPHLSIQSIINTIKAKIIPFESFQSSILDKIDQTIDELSKFKDQLQIRIQQDLSLYGLTKKDKQLFAALNQQQITGKQIIQFFHNAFCQENKFAEKQPLDIKFAQIWKSVDTEIKNKSGLLFQILQSVKDNMLTGELMLKDSKIKMEKREEINLIKMFGDKIPRSAKLLYRASQNNFKVDKFYEKCNCIPHTLTICETVYGKVIGGYNALFWDKFRQGQQQKDESGNSFIFSLTDNDKFIVDKSKTAIYHHTAYGPFFGSGHPDFRIDNSGNTSNCYAIINNCYLNSNYTAGNGDSYMKFTGNPDKSYYFKAKEWQVWRLQF